MRYSPPSEAVVRPAMLVCLAVLVCSAVQACSVGRAGTAVRACSAAAPVVDQMAAGAVYLPLNLPVWWMAPAGWMVLAV
jgi:hypothetical protein